MQEHFKIITKGDIMTREEAEEEWYQYVEDNTVNYTLSSQTVKNMFDFIQEIYDNFESRTCKNCKFDWCGCDIRDAIFRISKLDDVEMPNLDDFGCNRFERKS